MATYVVTNSMNDDYESGHCFKTRTEAERVFKQQKTLGKFVRLIRWDWVSTDNGRPTELARHPEE